MFDKRNAMMLHIRNAIEISGSILIDLFKLSGAILLVCVGNPGH